MSLFRSKTSMYFKVNENGETYFFFPVIAGMWCPNKGSRITSDADVEKLRKYLGIYFGVATAIGCPAALILVVRLVDGQVYSWMIPVLLCCAAAVTVFMKAFERLFIRKVLQKYERTAERLRFWELQRMQAESRAWHALILAGLLQWLFVAAGLFMILFRYEAGIGILFFIIFAPFGMHTAYLISLKRAGQGGTARD